MKTIKLFVLMAVLFLGLASAVSAADLLVKDFKINGNLVGEDCVDNGRCEETVDIYKLSDAIDIDLKLYNNGTNATDITLTAFLAGYEYQDRESIVDTAHVFDLKADRGIWQSLRIDVPHKFDKDVYDLRVLVSERTGVSKEFRLQLEVQGARHNLEIKGVVFSPDKVISGRSLLSYVRIKNYGQEDEDTVKVSLTIPELDLSVSEYVSELDSDDSITTEELYLRIPKCIECGVKEVEVCLEFDEGYEEVCESYSIEVVCDEDAICEKPSEPGTCDTIEGAVAQTIITVGSETQDVNAGGSSVIYPITITNMASSAKTYTVSVSGANFATFTVAPSNVALLESGASKAIYVNVNADADAEEGEHMFAIAVSAGGEVLKEIPLQANVVVKEVGSWDKVKKALEIGLVVLVVLLVILGLIVGFNKMKGSDDDDDEEGNQTYY